MTRASSPSSSQQWHCEYCEAEDYYIYQSGSHREGTFIRVYVPGSLSKPEATNSNIPTPELKSILYLHGFALCMPEFYEDHLVKLVTEGYIVFFPDFQRSFYPNQLPKNCTNKDFPPQPNPAHLKTWISVATHNADSATPATEIIPDLLSEFSTEQDAAKQNPAEQNPAEQNPAEQNNNVTGPHLSPGLKEVSAGELKRLARTLVIIIAFLKVISLFRQEYGKNLIHLLSTVALSLLHRPTEWLANTTHLAEEAWTHLAAQERYSHWTKDNLKTFAFGHSLGGLMALSLPFGLKATPNSAFFPKQIVTADPTPTTEQGIPKFAIAILKLRGTPFTSFPVEIKTTGPALTGPVAILHGGSDQLVPPAQWFDASHGQKSNYQHIASKQKAIYFSYSNTQKNPSLIAFHNQAVTSTQYYGNGLFKHFGGVKNGPNAYNNNYIWPGVNQVFAGTVSPPNLLPHLDQSEFQIKEKPPKQSPKTSLTIAGIIGLLLLLGIAYWIWTSRYALT
ncbi:MAG: hypothetical protein AB8B99_19575 [Phormidesmis sp.]